MARRGDTGDRGGPACGRGSCGRAVGDGWAVDGCAAGAVVEGACGGGPGKRPLACSGAGASPAPGPRRARGGVG